eukprot:gb/GEZN01000985.1/.p1 GENE.gb/GEZN01000985.1/~~gb/GEZN01000985.1/.p1  ORF type:complete len:1094 (+),score=229.87 gb/GEZN01000985.1/:27-3284(+)
MVVLGERRVSLKELQSISFLGDQVDLDKAALTKLEQATASRKGANPQEAEVPATTLDGECLSVPEVRGVIALRIIAFLKVRLGVRKEVVEFLAALLNQHVTPKLPTSSNEACLSALSRSCFPGASVLVLKDGKECELDQALPGISRPGLTVRELEAFTQGLAPSQALCLLGVAASRRLVDISLVVAALSCEAVQASRQTFQPDAQELVRRYTGCKETAQALRSLLFDSGLCDTSQRSDLDPPCFRNLPELHGAAEEQLQVAENSALVELNSSEASPPSHPGKSGFHSLPLLVPIFNLTVGLKVLCCGALQRSACILSEGKRLGVPSDPAVADAMAELQTSLANAGKKVELVKALTSQVVANADLEPNSLKAALQFVQVVRAVFEVVLAELEVSLEAVELRAAIFRQEKEKREAARAAQREARGQSGCFQGMSFAIPNSMGAIKGLVKKQGGKVGNKVNNKVQFVLAKSLEELSVKGLAMDAVGQGVPVVSEAWVEKSVEQGAPCTDEALFIHYVAPKSAAVSNTLTLGQGTRKWLSWLQQTRGGVPHLLASSSQQATDLHAWLADLLDPFTSRDRNLSLLLEQVLAPVVQFVKAKEPKGTRDTDPFQMAVRNKAFGIIRGTFDRHGAVGIDTPIFERKDTLMGKYGEDQKLIYDLKDQGGEILSLRYDLTVPFARYCASHGKEKIKRYHIGTVYRRDQPNVNKGRYREFFQCDFDIAGPAAPMAPEADVLKVLTEILDQLDLGSYRVKLNHRKLLDAMMAVCGVPAEKFRTICSAIDKLDKEPWDKVREEMTVEKGLEEAVADRIKPYVTGDFSTAAPLEVLAKLRADNLLSTHPSTKSTLNELETLFTYLRAMKCLDRISFDLSLARGLHYYTGVIYEALLTTEDGIGSIAAGGRYDGLIGMFSSNSIPAVGVSVGISRILAIMEQQESKRQAVRSSSTEILVASVGKEDTLIARMEICNQLWESGFKAEFLYVEAPKPGPQLDHAQQERIPYMVWIGSDELARGVVKIKEMATRQEHEVPRAEMCDFFTQVLKAQTVSVSAAGQPKLATTNHQLERLESRAAEAEQAVAALKQRVEQMEAARR